jgi:hypothetical protein
MDMMAFVTHDGMQFGLGPNILEELAALNMQTAISSKILVPINQTTHFHVPEQGSHYI